MASEAERRDAAIADYRKKLLKHKEIDTKVPYQYRDVDLVGVIDS